MSERINHYPVPCRENINTIVRNIDADEQTAYAMMLLTAALMDVCPSDPKVAEIILDDINGMRVSRKS